LGRTRECSGGFTLLELIVVIAIIAIASSVTMVEVGKRRDRTLFLDEVRHIALALKGARQSAVMERAEFSFYTGSDMDGIPYYWVERDGQPVGDSVSLPSGFELTEDSVTFYPRGYSNGVEFEVRDPKGRTAVVTVDSVLGKVTVEP